MILHSGFKHLQSGETVWDREQVIPKSQKCNTKGITPVAGEGGAQAAVAGHALV